MTMTERTKEGLAVVTKQTFTEFLKDYNIISPNNNCFLTERIKTENPEIYRILEMGMAEAPSCEAGEHFEMGIQIVYDLLRRQTLKDSKEN